MANNNMKAYAKQRAKETSTARPIAVGDRKSVDIKRAENGFIVSQWIPSIGDKPGRDRLIVCKTLEEAQLKAASLLKM